MPKNLIKPKKKPMKHQIKAVKTNDFQHSGYYYLRVGEAIW